MTPLFFQNIDAAKWQRIKDDLIVKAGITITKDEGEAEAKGIEIAWKYDPATLVLVVTPEKRAWFDPKEAVIDTDIQTWIEPA